MTATSHRSVASALDAAYDQWAYGEGWSAGLVDGRRLGFVDGYTVGFDAGAEVAATRTLLGIEHVLPGRLGTILPLLPDTAGYVAFRCATAPTDEPCEVGCGRCSRCIRALAVPGNVVRFGRPDFPGGLVPWSANGWTVRRGQSR